MFIGIAGIIGAGKSTLAQSLADHLGYDTYNEPVDDNPYLDDFYADMNRWGAMMQIHLLFRRFEQHQQIVWKKEKGRGAGPNYLRGYHFRPHAPRSRLHRQA